MLLRTIILKNTQAKQSKKKKIEKSESVCVSPTSVVISIIEFQTIRRVLRKEKPLKMCKWKADGPSK